MPLPVNWGAVAGAATMRIMGVKVKKEMSIIVVER
jgi:hypothetical protein